MFRATLTCGWTQLLVLYSPIDHDRRRFRSRNLQQDVAFTDLAAIADVDDRCGDHFIGSGNRRGRGAIEAEVTSRR